MAITIFDYTGIVIATQKALLTRMGMQTEHSTIIKGFALLQEFEMVFGFENENDYKDYEFIKEFIIFKLTKGV